jgi:hypothetical protein
MNHTSGRAASSDNSDDCVSETHTCTTLILHTEREYCRYGNLHLSAY